MTPDRIQFYFVDVFASRPLTGNPLTLVPNADHLDTAQMQAVAREFNQSETTFLLRPTHLSAQWRLRSFTPAGFEVGGAGHNALGAWLWLADTAHVVAGEFTQQIGDDLLPVTVARGVDGVTTVTMNQTAPRFGRIVADTAPVAAALALDSASLDTSFAVQAVSTGVSHLLVPVCSTDVVDGVRPDPRALLPILQSAGGEGCYVFSTHTSSLEPRGAHAYARFFNPTVGISEDPATGTAAGPLAAALVHAGYVPDATDVVIEQGHLLGRPSRLTVHVDGDDVRLAGSGLIVGEGWLTV